MRPRTLFVAVVVIAIAAVAVVMLGRGDRAAGRTATATPDAGTRVPAASRREAPRRQADATSPPRWVDRAAPESPVLDEITVDKAEVCNGEQVLFTIAAHTAGGDDDPFLHGSIADRPGLSVPVVVARGPDGTMPLQHAVIYGRAGATPTVVELPEVKIKDCDVYYRVLIATRPRVNTVDELDFSAEVAAGATSAPFEPVSYRWSFGDGAEQQTTEPQATHSYADREQDRLYSDFVVGVEAIDKRGQVARGRITVPLLNPAFERLVRDGETLLLAAPTPRFAVADPDGVIRQRVRLWHRRAGDVALDRVVVRTTRRDGTRSEGLDEDPGAALGADLVPRDGVWIELAIGADNAATVATREYQLFGTSADGLPAAGTFTIMLVPEADQPLEIDMGPPPPTPDAPTGGGGSRQASPDDRVNDKGKE